MARHGTRKTLHSTPTPVNLEFNSLREIAINTKLVEYARKLSYRAEGGVVWSGGTFEDALKIAQGGDTEHAAEIETAAAEIVARLDYSGIVDGWQQAEAGAIPIVPEYLQGSPESMLEYSPRPSDVSPIDIYATIGAFSSWSAEDMRQHGIAIAAAIMAIGKIRPVRVHFIASYTYKGDTNFILHAADPVDISEIAALTCAPCVTRQLLFGVIKRNKRDILAPNSDIFSVEGIKRHFNIQGDALIFPRQSKPDTREKTIRTLNETIRQFGK